MKRGFWMGGAALVVALFVAAQAQAAVYNTAVKTDTLNLYMADSSAVINVENAGRMWLDIILMPIDSGDFAYASPECDPETDGEAACDAQEDSARTAQVDSVNTAIRQTTFRLAVQVREVLTRDVGTDSTYAIRLAAQAGNADPAVSATALHTMSANLPSAVSDTTYVPWLPQHNLHASTTVDSLPKLNKVQTGPWSTASNELHVYFPSQAAAPHYSSPRSVRVELVNLVNGVPFRAKYASFRWRMIGPTATQTYAKFKVVLGRETW